MTDNNLELQWPWWRMFQLDKFISQVYLEIRVLKVNKHDEISIFFYFIFKLYITVLVLPNNWPAGISRRLQNSKNLQCKFHCQRLFKKIKGKDFVVVLVAKSCPTLWDPMDCSPPGSSVYGIFQARILEWVAFSSSKGSFLPRYQTWVSCIGRGFFTTEPPGKPEDKGI